LAVIALAVILGHRGWHFPDGRMLWISIGTGLYALIFSWRMWRNPYYVYFEYDENLIRIRYCSLRPLVIKKYAIEMHPSKLAGFEIVTSQFGLRKVLILSENRKGKIAKYPGVCINFLKKKERKELLSTLNQIIQNNNK
jgi:hypothetical protein